MALPPGTPGRAYVRLYEALRTQLPDDGAATTFEVRTRDADGAPRHDRTFSATSVSEPELLASADAVLRSPVPEGDGIAYRVGVDLSGHRPGVDGQYQSMNLVLRPAGDESVEELLDSPEILERGHHLAETMAAPCWARSNFALRAGSLRRGRAIRGPSGADQRRGVGCITPPGSARQRARHAVPLRPCSALLAERRPMRHAQRGPRQPAAK